MQVSRVGIVTEYCSKGSLANLIENEAGKLPWAYKQKVLLDIAKGMYFLHSKSVIHRDLKSDNILVCVM